MSNAADLKPLRPLPAANDPLDVLPVADAAPAGPVLDALPADAPIPDVLPVPEPERRSLLGILFRAGASTWYGIGCVAEWVFGVVTLIVGLAVLASVPVLGFLSLGYLLEAGARIARTRRLTAGFIGIRPAARIGGIALGVGLMLIPVMIVANLAQAAEIIEPGGLLARRYRLGWFVLVIVLAMHTVLALSRGGKLRYFLWPFGNPFWLVRKLRQGTYYAEASAALWRFVGELRLAYYFWLGLCGFLGAFLWLAPPITLLALGQKNPLVGFLGAFGLGLVLFWVPFLQMRFAEQNRFKAFLEVGAVIRGFFRAPWACTFAFVLTLASAVPLYLLKVETMPREVAWLPGLVFIVFIYPARLVTGFAYSRTQVQPWRFWLFRGVRWLGWVVLPPLALVTVALYVFIIFLTQYTSWDGVFSLYEQHAFLLPVPFIGT